MNSFEKPIKFTEHELADLIWNDLVCYRDDQFNQFKHRFDSYNQLISVNDQIHFESISIPYIRFMFTLHVNCEENKHSCSHYITMYTNDNSITPFSGSILEKLLLKKIFSLEKPITEVDMTGEIHHLDYDSQIKDLVLENIKDHLLSFKHNDEFLDKNIKRFPLLAEYMSSFFKTKALMENL